MERMAAERAQAERLAALSDPLLRFPPPPPPHSSAGPAGAPGASPGGPGGLQHTHTHQHTHLHLHQQANDLHGQFVFHVLPPVAM